MVRALATLVEPARSGCADVMNPMVHRRDGGAGGARRAPGAAGVFSHPERACGLEVPQKCRYPLWRELRRALIQSSRSCVALPLVLMPYAWPPAGILAAAKPPELDSMLSRRRPFAWLGDHLHMVAEQKPRPGYARRA